jgi:hypothetical protein
MAHVAFCEVGLFLVQWRGVTGRYDSGYKYHHDLSSSSEVAGCVHNRVLTGRTPPTGAWLHAAEVGLDSNTCQC